MHTVKMNAPAMRSLMGDSFDPEQFEKGQQDARKLLREHPEEMDAHLKEVQSVLANGSYQHRPGPSYWVGCLSVFDFI